MATQPGSESARPGPGHEHTMQLVAVVFEDAGHATREMACWCGARWFE